jgi:hypothetical protein
LSVVIVFEARNLIMRQRSVYFAASITLLWSTSALAASPWVISEKTGTVMIVRGGATKAAARGGELAPGDLISTAPGARAVLIRGEEYLVVSPGSRLRIAAPKENGVVTQIIEEAGNVIFKIKKMATPHFGVQTPYLAAVVKGTTFSVTVTDTGAAVQVIEGAVEVATNDGGAKDLVRPGVIAHVGRGDQYRLTVEGATVKTIDSPQRATQPTVVPTETSSTTPTEAKNEVVSNADERVEHSVGEDAAPIAQSTSGLISNDTHVASVVELQRVASVVPTSSVPASQPDAVPSVANPTDTTPVVTPTPTTSDLPANPAPTPIEPIVAVPAETVPVALPPAPVSVSDLPPAPVGGGTQEEVTMILPPPPLETVAALPPTPIETPPVSVESPPVFVPPVDVVVALPPTPVETPPVPVDSPPAAVPPVDVVVALPPEPVETVTPLPPVLLDEPVIVVVGNNGNGYGYSYGNNGNGGGNNGNGGPGGGGKIISDPGEKVGKILSGLSGNNN